jgi:hypothetical protein
MNLDPTVSTENCHESRLVTRLVRFAPGADIVGLSRDYVTVRIQIDFVQSKARPARIMFR